jgi:hypothetical protein
VVAIVRRFEIVQDGMTQELVVLDQLEAIAFARSHLAVLDRLKELVELANEADDARRLAGK